MLVEQLARERQVSLAVSVASLDLARGSGSSGLGTGWPSVVGEKRELISKRARARRRTAMSAREEQLFLLEISLFTRLLVCELPR